MTPVTVTLCPTMVVVPVAERSAPAMVTSPAVDPTPRLPPAVMEVRRLVDAVSDVVADLRLVFVLLSALLFSSAEVMLTPFVPVRVYEHLFRKSH